MFHHVCLSTGRKLSMMAFLRSSPRFSVLVRALELTELSPSLEVLYLYLCVCSYLYLHLRYNLVLALELTELSPSLKVFFSLNRKCSFFAAF